MFFENLLEGYHSIFTNLRGGTLVFLEILLWGTLVFLAILLWVILIFFQKPLQTSPLKYAKMGIEGGGDVCR